MLQETATKAFEQFKRARKAEEGRVIELHVALSQVQEVVAPILPADEGEGAAAAADATAGGGDENKMDGMDVEMQDTEAADGPQEAVP
jgi:hypothetical protein